MTIAPDEMPHLGSSDREVIILPGVESLDGNWNEGQLFAVKAKDRPVVREQGREDRRAVEEPGVGDADLRIALADDAAVEIDVTP